MDTDELKDLPEGVRRVTDFLRDKGHLHQPVMLNDAVRTAQQAVDALGIEVGQIAKSIIFQREADDVAVPVADVVQRAEVPVESAAVPSPCNSVCRMDPATGWCAGCFRTLDEITNWSRMAPAEQRALCGVLEQRTRQAVA